MVLSVLALATNSVAAQGSTRTFGSHTFDEELSDRAAREAMAAYVGYAKPAARQIAGRQFCPICNLSASLTLSVFVAEHAASTATAAHAAPSDGSSPTTTTTTTASAPKRTGFVGLDDDGLVLAFAGDASPAQADDFFVLAPFDTPLAACANESRARAMRAYKPGLVVWQELRPQVMELLAEYGRGAPRGTAVRVVGHSEGTCAAAHSLAQSTRASVEGPLPSSASSGAPHHPNAPQSLSHSMPTRARLAARWR